MSDESSPVQFITPEALLDHWLGHRRLTRRLIEAFPEDQLFNFRVGPMRPWGLMALEIIGMAVPIVQTMVSGDSAAPDHHRDEWVKTITGHANPKAEVLRLWDESTEQINALWPQIPPQRFEGTMTVFGQYSGPVHSLFLYVIDNEIHHRGQGYVYLRLLGIDTPLFYVRD